MVKVDMAGAALSPWSRVPALVWLGRHRDTASLR